MDSMEITAVRTLKDGGKVLVMVRRWVGGWGRWVGSRIHGCLLLLAGALVVSFHTPMPTRKTHTQRQWVKNLKDGTETHAEQTFEKAP